MFISYTQIHNNSYIVNKQTSQIEIKQKLLYVEECCNDDCVYNRSNTCLRHKYEIKLGELIKKKDNCKLLFFNPYKLLQELNILLTYGTNVSEVHLIDFQYKDIANFMIIFGNIIMEFVNTIYSKYPNILIYIHSFDENFYDYYNSYFDIIGAIDIGNKQNYCDTIINVLLSMSLKCVKETGCLVFSDEIVQGNNNTVFFNTYEKKSDKLLLLETNIYTRDNLSDICLN
jgi:hypothetical protein